MKRDYERVARQIESVIAVLNRYSENNQVISIGKACREAGIHEAWLYRVLNNIDDYQLSDELLERLEYARDGVISVIIQRLDSIADCNHHGDSLDSLVQDEDSSSQSSNNKDKDSGTRIARDTLRLKHEQWKYRCLLPKHFNDGVDKTSLAITNNTNNNQYNLLLSNLSPEQLKAIASIKILSQSNNNE